MSKYQQKNSEFNLTPVQIAAIIESEGVARNRLILCLLAYTGMRRAEIRALNVEDIDLASQRILVRNGKGGKQRLVFFPPTLRDAISTQIAQCEAGPLFRGRKIERISLRTLNNIVAAAGRNSGIDNPNPRYKNLNPHLFRHSFARNWKRRSASQESLQKILGHSRLATTMDLYGTEGLFDVESNYHAMAALLVDSTKNDSV